MPAGFVHTVSKGGEWINELEDGGPLLGGPYDVKEVASPPAASTLWITRPST